jgi:hypothetical protein
MFMFSDGRQEDRQKILGWIVASITSIQTPLNSLLNQVLSIIVVPKYLNCATFLKHRLAVLCHDFALYSGDQTATYT